MTKTFLTIAVAMAFAIALTVVTTTKRGEEEGLLTKSDDILEVSSKDMQLSDEKIFPSRRISRFLAEEKDNRPKYHCNKDNDVCYEAGSSGNTCCNNKCIDIKTDDKNCGACKQKCKYTESCCNGKCVYLAFDKRNCGECSNKCMHGGYCIYGLCDYA
ncbi:Stigma-specific stig1-like protein [Thalictrum thalictroides]|uniref:Stigma-specific stig1-like protein n=1 Tax=Thalictrum thalictroides TaxID=46969 RepID=A0A7J6WYQ2_THATH|nr:Stigma-specific stig1-like protein [Thalictrum thalictroides]